MRAYYYLFYKIYKSIEYTSEALGGKFLTDFKTIIVISTLEVWLLFLIFNIRSLIRNEKLEIDITHPFIIIPSLIIIVGNYFLFVHIDKWKEYNAEFDKLPREKDIVGGIIVWAIIILITVGYWTSGYLVQKNVLGV